MSNSEHRKLYRRIWMRRNRGTSTEPLPPPPIKIKEIKSLPKIGKYEHLFENM